MSTKIGRNQKCPCGSGRKYKHCCLLYDQTVHIEQKQEKQPDLGTPEDVFKNLRVPRETVDTPDL